MDDVIDVSVVADVDADWAAFSKAQNRARNPVIVGKRVNHLAGGEFQPVWRNSESVVWRRYDLRICRVNRGPDRYPGCACAD